MQERYVTDPDDMQWVVGRKFLFGPPRYRGFRFGLGREREFEPASDPILTVPDSPAALEGLAPHRVLRDRPVPDGTVNREPRARYRDVDGHWHPPRRGPGWIPIPMGSGGGSGGFGGSGGGSGGGGMFSGGGVREGVGGGVRGGGGERGGAGAGGMLAGAGGVFAVLGKVLWWVFIVVAVAAAIFLTVFVLLPAILLALQFVIIGLLIGWRAMTGRPWVVEARQNRAAPLVHAWEVTGWRESARVRDEVADALRRGEEPAPRGAEPVAVEGA